MGWSCWCPAHFVILFFLFAKSNGDYSTGALQAIRCMLAHSAPRDCTTLAEVPVPTYLVQAFNEKPSSLHDALRSRPLSTLSNAQVASLPLSLLYLIPRGQLTDLNGTQLGAIIQQHANDTSLARQVAASLQHSRHFVQLIHKLKVSFLDEEVLQILVETLGVFDLKKPFFEALPRLKEPFLAYLHPNVLLTIDQENFNRVILTLDEKSKPSRKGVIHVLAQAAIKHKLSFSRLKWLLSGLTPDQIRNQSLHVSTDTSSFKQDLSHLQARAVFESHYKSMTTLHRADFIDSKPLLLKLSPRLLQRFPVMEQKWDLITKPSQLSLPTACQIREFLKADGIITAKLLKEGNQGSRIRYLGKWVSTLSLADLKEYLDAPLGAYLPVVESPALSPLQIFYLTGRGHGLDVVTPNSVLELHSFLDALPASQLANRRVGDISSDVMHHLVAALPANNLPRTLCLVYKIASGIGDRHILENLLQNRDVNMIMNQVSPKDLQASRSLMLKEFKDKQQFWPVIEQLPQQILASLLEEAMIGKNWSWQTLLDKSHVNHLLTGGLTCQHIEDMETGLFIPIIAQYNRQRKQPFPKNLQYCCLQKLVQYLKLKMELSQMDSSYGLISVLEPIDVEAVGGYVLVGLPIETMKVSPYLGNILTAIGKLSNTELMLAANMNRIQSIAQLAVDKEGNVDVFVAGNLVWFLPLKANVPQLRLVLEAGRLDRTLCLPREARRSLATRLIGFFGPPETWSAGVLATLKDLLVVFSEDELNRVNKTIWTEAADCLGSHYGDIIDWIDPAPFHQVCSNVLGKSEGLDFKTSVIRLVKWLLRAAQWQLDTVQHDLHADPPAKTIMTLSDLDLDEEPPTPISPFRPTYDPDEDRVEHSTEMTTLAPEEDLDEDSESTEENSEETTTEINTTTSTSMAITTTEATEQSSTKQTIASTEEHKHSEPHTITPSSTKLETSSVKTTPAISSKNVSVTQNAVKSTTLEIPAPKKIENEGLPTLPTSTFKIKEIRPTDSPLIHTYERTTLSQETNAEIALITEKSTSEENKDEEKIKAPSTEPISKFSFGNESTSTITKWKQVGTTETIMPLVHNSTIHSLETISEATTTTVKINETAKISTDLNVTTTVSSLTEQKSSKNFSKDTTFENSTTTPDSSEYKVKISTNTSSTAAPLHEVSKPSNINVFENETNNNVENVQNASREELSSKESTSTSKPALNTTLKVEILPSTSRQPPTEISKISNSTKEISTANSKDGDEATGEDENDDEVYDDDSKEFQNQQSILESYDTNNGTNGRKKREAVQYEGSMQLSCNAIKMVGSLASLTITEADLSEMSDSELDDCRVELGAMNLSLASNELIWKRITKEGIHLLSYVLRGAHVSDLWDMEWDASQPWALETIHAFTKHVNNSVVLNKLLKKITDHNYELPPELLAVLGSSVCSLEVEGTRKLSVVDLVPSTDCPACLPRLAQLAVEQLGAVSLWSPHHVHSLHSIVAGLEIEDWKTLIESSSKPLTGLQPSAIRCLNISHLQVMTTNEIKLIPTQTLLALSPQQKEGMTMAQLWAIGNMTELVVTEKMNPTKVIVSAGIVPSGGSPKHDVPLYLVVLISLCYILQFIK